MLQRFQRRRRREDAELYAVIENLNHILNTFKGFGSFVKELGIGDYNVYKSKKKIIETIIAEIKQNVALYEPRVRLEQIEQVDSDSPFRLRFQVKCVFNEGARPIYIVLDSFQKRVFVEET